MNFPFDYMLRNSVIHYFYVGTDTPLINTVHFLRRKKRAYMTHEKALKLIK